LNAKAVFLCNPNNPTSMLIPHDALMEIVVKARDEEILVFLDEDFIEFVNEEKRHSFANIIKSFPNVFVLRTFTKFYGLTGLRVGYGIADEKTSEVFSRVKIPWNVNSLAQVAAVAALADAEHSKRTLEVVRNEKEFLFRELAKIKCFKVFPADTNFIFIDVRQSGFSANQLKINMLKLGLIVRDCSSFVGLDSYYLRVAVRNRAQNARLLDAFRRVLKHVS